MADLSSVEAKLNDTEVGADKPASESLFTKIGENINYAIDKNATQDSRLTALEAKSTNIAIGSSSGASGTSATVTITGVTSGKVRLNLQPQGTAVGVTPGYNTGNSNITLYRGATAISSLGYTISGDAPILGHSFSYIDTASGTGSITYTISAAGTGIIKEMQLVAEEIKDV